MDDVSVLHDQTAIRWDRIEQFIGYGPADAPIVFIGMEEGGDNARLREDLTYAYAEDRGIYARARAMSAL